MKKLFAIMAVCLMCVACASPADKAVDYLESIKAAAESSNYEEVTRITEEMANWMDTLTEEELVEVQEAQAAWYRSQLDEEGFDYEY